MIVSNENIKKREQDGKTNSNRLEGNGEEG